MIRWSWRRMTAWSTRRRGGKEHAWAYTHRDVAQAKGVSVHAVKRAIARGRLDMTDLTSVSRYVLGVRKGPGTKSNHG